MLEGYTVRKFDKGTEFNTYLNFQTKQYQSSFTIDCITPYPKIAKQIRLQHLPIECSFYSTFIEFVRVDPKSLDRSVIAA